MELEAKKESGPSIDCKIVCTIPVHMGVCESIMGAIDAVLQETEEEPSEQQENNARRKPGKRTYYLGISPNAKLVSIGPVSMKRADFIAKEISRKTGLKVEAYHEFPKGNTIKVIHLRNSMKASSKRYHDLKDKRKKKTTSLDIRLGSGLKISLKVTSSEESLVLVKEILQDCLNKLGALSHSE